MALKISQNMCTRFKRYETKRAYKLDSIQVHSIGCAQNSIDPIRDNMNQYSPGGIVHAIVSADIADTVVEILPEDNVAWADGGYGNNHSYTFEIAESDYMQYTGGANFIITNRARFLEDVWRGYNTAVQFTAMLCKKYGFNPTEKLANGLHRVYSHNEGREKGLSTAHVDPTHLWGANSINKTMDDFRADVAKAMGQAVIEEKWYRVGSAWVDGKCVGQIEADRDFKNAVATADRTGLLVFDPDGKEVYRPTVTVGTQASSIAALANEKVKAAAMLELVHRCDKSGILNSVTTAQMILESGYCGTSLAIGANNCFGMKANLSSNTWKSVWDGTSVYNKKTAEQDKKGNTYYIYADFRKYPDVEHSIQDHAAYLLGAMNGSSLRYAGLTAAKNYREAITIIKKGGYATDVSYIEKICDIVQRYGLDKYDTEPAVEPSGSSVPEETPGVEYVVQTGAFEKKANANRELKSVKALGYADAFITKSGPLWCVQTGVFSYKDNADRQGKRLASQGKDVYIKERTAA